MNNILLIVIGSLVVEAITEIIVSSKITDGLREWLNRLGNPIVGSRTRFTFIFTFLSNLINCGYCASVHVSMIVSIFMPDLIGFPFWCWLFNTILLHRLSNFIHDLLMIVKKGRVQTHDLEVKLINNKQDGSQFFK